MYEAVLQFWFEEIAPAKWWIADPEFDAEVRSRFGGLLIQASLGELAEWRDAPEGRLAEIVVLDQFSRNVYRGTPQAFSQDAMALALSQESIRARVQQSLSPVQMTFLLLPFMHSESRKIHELAMALFREFAPRENFEFELKHKVIIDRFGRFPHRNAVLGRTSTAEELEFLKQPGSAF